MFTLGLRKTFKSVSKCIRRVQRIFFRLKRLSFFFSRNVWSSINIGSRKENDSEFSTKQLTKLSWLKITCWVERFTPKQFFWWFRVLKIVSGVFEEKISKVWWKFNGRVAKAAFFVSRAMLFGKIVLSRSSFFFIKFLVLRKKVLTSGKEFCQGCWKSTLRVQRVDVWRRYFIWNYSIILLLHHFRTLSGKKNQFWEKGVRQSF